jgi:hypothetical protein
MDPDDDGDGYSNKMDPYPNDFDNDATPDAIDPCPRNPNCDGDSLPDRYDKSPTVTSTAWTPSPTR